MLDLLGTKVTNCFYRKQEKKMYFQLKTKIDQIFFLLDLLDT